jgi:superfamily II DNA helicase RecQ
VVYATEALGVGVNLPDVRRVVQYGLPTRLEPAVFWQRGGRACRDGHNGEIILLIDQWVQGKRVKTPQRQLHLQDEAEQDEEQRDDEPQYREDSSFATDPIVNTGSDNNPQHDKKLTPAQCRGRLPDFWYNLLNNDGCLREQFLDHFNEIYN